MSVPMVGSLARAWIASQRAFAGTQKMFWDVYSSRSSRKSWSRSGGMPSAVSDVLVLAGLLIAPERVGSFPEALLQ